MLLKEQLPVGLSMCAATTDDIPAIAALIAIAEQHSLGEVVTTEAEMRMLLSGPDIDLARDTFLIHNERDELVGLSVALWRAPACVNAISYLHPDYQTDQLTKLTMDLAEERAWQWLPRVPEGARFYISAFFGSGEEQLLNRLAGLGYQPVRRFWHMKIDLLQEPPRPQWAEGIEIQTVRGPEQYQAVYEAEDRFFQDHWGHTSVSKAQWLNNWPGRTDGNFDPSLMFLAMHGEEIVGIALCVNEQAQGGWIHELAVDRDWRRHGLGLALLYHAFGEFYRRGVKEVFLNVDSESLTGATRLYTRAGMHVVRQFVRLEKDLRPGRELELRSLE